MKEKFKKFFLALQQKGHFEGVDFDDMTEEDSQELHGLYLSHLDEELEKAQKSLEESGEENKGLKDSISLLKSEQEKYNSEYSALNLKLAKAMTKQIIDAGMPNEYDTDPRINAAFKELKTVYDKIHKSVGEDKKVTYQISSKTLLRVVNSIKADTLTTSVANSTRGVMDPEVARLTHRRLTAYESIIRKITIPMDGGGTYRYLDQDAVTSIRAAAQVAEGNPAPESTIAWIEEEIKLKKTADHLPYSDEFAYDFRNLMIELAAFLRDNVNIIVDDQIINGDGLGDNYDSMTSSIPAYVPVAASVQDPNLFDLTCKVSDDITDTEGSKYQPNVVYLNSTDIVGNDLMLKKDANNNYVPIMRMLNEKGFTVIENNSLAANTMIVGDNRFARMIEDGVITVKTGLHTGDDAIEGIERILVSTRKNLLIKNLEQTGWRLVTDIQAALTTIGT